MRRALASLTVAASFLTLVMRAPAQDASLPPETTFNATAGRGDLVWINIRFDTAVDYLFGVDTGATLTVLDKSWEPKLKPYKTNSVVGARWAVSGVFSAPPLLLGGVPLRMGQMVVTEDLPAHFSGRPVAGILGMDCLGHYCVQFDFTQNKLRFLDPRDLNPQNLGKAFPIEPLRGCFFAHDNLAGIRGFDSLIDTGCNFDGVLTPPLFQQWTNQTSMIHYPGGFFGGLIYTNLYLAGDGERNLIGLHLLARNLVTLNFPGQTLYLLQQSVGPLPAETNHFANFYKNPVVTRAQP
jgi:hypothetical protein